MIVAKVTPLSDFVVGCLTQNGDGEAAIPKPLVLKNPGRLCPLLGLRSCVEWSLFGLHHEGSYRADISRMAKGI